MKIIIPSNNVDIWTILEVLPRFKLSSHTDSLTEASDLIIEIFKGAQMQKERRIDLDKF